MLRIFKLYNSYTKRISDVSIAGIPIRPCRQEADLIHGSLYICGPTVYSESHLGHALTYVRADLFRRFLKSFFNVKLITAMNITDIDDKILAKTYEEYKHARGSHRLAQADENASFSQNPAEHPFSMISDIYYKSFVDDMRSIRVLPPDLTLKVSKQVDLIAKFIEALERKGHAYQTSDGDIYFSCSSIRSYVGRIDARKSPTRGDSRDFALWKAAKPNEPVWRYVSPNGSVIPGRPGWHVQCSTIASSVFGKQLDFHLGGQDLYFPHNYNEEACCCAFHGLDTSESLHVWSKNWIHFGHLIIRDEKMSKSIGNVVPIKEFAQKYSVNIIRLLCIMNHYRSNINLDDNLIRGLATIDHKLSAFSTYLADEARHLRDDGPLNQFGMGDLSSSVQAARETMIDGLCDDFDLGRGLDAILDLTKVVYSLGTRNIKPTDLVQIRTLFSDWCHTCGLEYETLNDSRLDTNLLGVIQDFRCKIRSLAIDRSKVTKSQPVNEELNSFSRDILNTCDTVRAALDKLGYVIRDQRSKK